MNKRSLTLNLMKKNHKDYLLYLWGNIIAIAICQAFAAIYTNPYFMNEDLVDPMISSNIIAPSVFTIGFMLLFIPYAYRTFFHKRKNEYAVLLALGGTEKDVMSGLVVENTIICSVSLIAGLAFGTVIGIAFFEIVRHLLGINGVRWQFTLLSYGVSTTVYLIPAAVTFVIVLLDFAKAQINTMLKARSRGEKKIRGEKNHLLFSGLLFFAAAALLLRYLKTQASWVLPLGFGLTLAGLWLFLNGACIFWRNRTHGPKPKNAFLSTHFRSYHTVAFLVAVLFGITIFLTSISAVTYPELLNNAEKSSPYDLLYIETGGNNGLSLEKAGKILDENNIAVSVAVEIPYQRNGVFSLFSATLLNRLTGSDYHVSKGDYLVVYPYNLQDGYRHDMNIKGPLHFPCANGNMMLNYTGKDIRILFNQNPGFADKTLVLNDADYNTIKNTGSDYISGIIRCFRFQSSSDAALALPLIRQTLDANNHYTDASEKDYFAVSAKLDTEKTARQSASFLILTVSFVAILFVFAANTILYYHILNESEDFKTMMRSLFRIGITEAEAHALIRSKNRFYSFFPLACGALGATFFTSAFTLCCGDVKTGAFFAVALSLLLFLLEALVYALFTRIDEKPA